MKGSHSAAVAFGNLALLYSRPHSISVDTATLFNKLGRRQLGGYCVEDSTLFATLLRSLG